MPGNFKQYDLRIIKTNKFLIEALAKLLSQRSFAKITVNDICEEAQMSRTAFYSHYDDKYDLLKTWLNLTVPKLKINDHYDQLEKTINQIIETNKYIIANLLKDANNETLEILNECISTFLEEFIMVENTSSSCNQVLFSFCSGGIISLILWQIKNKFPTSIRLMNVHIFKILDAIRQAYNNSLDGGVNQ